MSDSSSIPSTRAPAVGPHPEHGLRRFAEYAFLLSFVEGGAFDDFLRLRIADREGLIRAEHDACGTRFFRQVFERIRIEHAGIEVHRREALARVGVLAQRIGVVARETPERIGQGSPAVREHEFHSRKFEEVPGEEQPRHRDRGVGEPADRVHQIVVRKPRLAAQEHRSEEHTSELQSLTNLVCRLLLEKKKKKIKTTLPFPYRQKTSDRKSTST